jgi:predicted nucleic acid-binding protein
MTNKRCTIDTNVLIYAIDRDSGNKHTIAMQVIEKAMDMDCILTTQALAEFYSAATKKGYATHHQVVACIEAWQQVFPIVGNNEQVLMSALAAKQTYSLSFWDAMIWASAKEARCGLLLTEDFQNGQKIDGIVIQNPFIKP